MPVQAVASRVRTSRISVRMSSLHDTQLSRAEACHVFARGVAKEAFVFAAELGAALVAYLVRRHPGLEAVVQHHQPRPVQAQGLDVLRGEVAVAA